MLHKSKKITDALTTQIEKFNSTTDYVSDVMVVADIDPTATISDVVGAWATSASAEGDIITRRSYYGTAEYTLPAFDIVSDTDTPTSIFAEDDVTIQGAINRLCVYKNRDEPMLINVIDKEDIESIATSVGYTLTDDEIKDTMRYVGDNLDISIGINTKVITDAVIELKNR